MPSVLFSWLNAGNSIKRHKSRRSELELNGACGSVKSKRWSKLNREQDGCMINGRIPYSRKLFIPPFRLLRANSVVRCSTREEQKKFAEQKREEALHLENVRIKKIHERV